MSDERMPPVTGLVPMIGVADIERSAVFYGLLGFVIGNRAPREGRMGWAWLYQPLAPNWRRGANLMLLRMEEKIDPREQRIHFYLYATDLVALRDELIRAGRDPAAITYPEHLPKGEFRLDDPDGFRLTIAQSVDDTP
jgi:hypothetical protein